MSPSPRSRFERRADTLHHSTAPEASLYSFDHLSPGTRNESLPLVIFYAVPTAWSSTASHDEATQSFQNLFRLVHGLTVSSVPATANPKAQGQPPASASSAGSPRLQVALRWGASIRRTPHIDDPPPSKLFLSGYGAGLDIKKSDYLAIDDRLAESGKAATPLEGEGEDSTPKMDPVKKSDIAGVFPAH